MIGIVILNYQNWNDTICCIQSIRESEKSSESIFFHIYLVDNASPNGVPKEIYEMANAEDITLIINKKNKGYAAGNNVGIKRALKDKCDTVLISNNDVRFENGCISGMYKYLKQNPEVGIVGPKILDGDGNIQKSCLCRKTGLKEKYLVRTRLNIFFRKQHQTYFGHDRDYDTAFRVHAVLGCCFMISGECTQEVFPFDEGTFLYEEEYIVGIRMEEKGFITMYNPDFVIRHLHGQSTGQIKPFAYTCETESEIYYCRKYLKANKAQIFPLYLYRIIKYYGKCLRSKEFYNYRREFMRKVKAKFWNGD